MYASASCGLSTSWKRARSPGEEILAQFYDSEDVLGFDDGNAWVKPHPVAHRWHDENRYAK